jgi:hypothetical protein
MYSCNYKFFCTLFSANEHTDVAVIHLTEHTGTAVMLQACILEELGSNLGQDAGYFVVFVPLSTNVIVRRLEYGYFLPDPFHFIHQLSYHSML